MSFHGILLVDKPPGMTSHDVVGKARKLLKTKSVGHAGTLDPMATGLMVILVGEATKLSNYILNGDKAYLAEIQLGQLTDTWDREGETLKQEDVDFSEQEVLSAVSELKGPLNLQVPSYAAIKVKGKKLYEYAREGQEIEAVYREMNFYTVEPIAHQKDVFKVNLSCSKGSYIRSWAFELGNKLNCGACLKELRRTDSAPYHIDMAKPLEEVSELLNSSATDKAIIPLEMCLPDWPEIVVEGREEKLLCNGTVSASLASRLKIVDKRRMDLGIIDSEKRLNMGIKVVSSDAGRLLSILVPRDQWTYKIGRVFNG